MTGDMVWLGCTTHPEYTMISSMVGKYNAKAPECSTAILKSALRYALTTVGTGLSPDIDANPGLRYSTDTDFMGMHSVDGTFVSRYGVEVSYKNMPVAWASAIIPGTKRESEIKMSSGEAESAGAAEALKLARYCQFIAQEMLIDCSDRINLEADATVAIAFSNGGTSKMKHIDARLAWVQSLRDKEVVRLVKVAGEDNPAHFYTNLMPAVEFRKQLARKKKVKKIVQINIGESVSD